MAFFKFPYSSFNQVNLDWIMRTLKKLEPAATLVEDAAATLAEAQQTAEAAQEAVDTVTAQAAEAVATAEEAKDIAEQAAQATVVDGSITRAKLAADVTGELDGLRTDVDAATITANNALSAAGVAQRLGTQAAQAASTAQSSADAAQNSAATANSAAAQAGSAAAAAQNTANTALAFATQALSIFHVADATATGTDYNLNADGTTRFAIIIGSAAGADHNSIFYVDIQASAVRLLGNPASGVTISISGGVFRLVSSVTANVWICPLPF